MIVIDSIVGYLNAMAQERYLVLQLHELLSYLGQAGVLSILVLGQTRGEGSPLASVDISYLADTVIITQMSQAAGEDAGRTISVYKRRSGAHEMAARPLTLGPVGISLGEPIDLTRNVPEELRG
jgi:circadian clock protein KaiC